MNLSLRVQRLRIKERKRESERKREKEREEVGNCAFVNETQR